MIGKLAVISAVTSCITLIQRDFDSGCRASGSTEIIPLLVVLRLRAGNDVGLLYPRIHDARYLFDMHLCTGCRILTASERFGYSFLGSSALADAGIVAGPCQFPAAGCQ
jgi:hypothetical protein